MAPSPSLGDSAIPAGRIRRGSERPARRACRAQNGQVGAWRKPGGLLVEVAGEAAGPSLVVVGVGINTRLGAGGAGIDQPWADLEEVLGKGGCERNRAEGLPASETAGPPAAEEEQAQDPDGNESSAPTEDDPDPTEPAADPVRLPLPDPEPPVPGDEDAPREGAV